MGVGEHPAERRHIVQLEEGIGVRLRAGEFEREAAVGGHLHRDELLGEPFTAGGERGLVAREFREDGDLQPEGDRVVVLLVGFFLAVGAGEHPVLVVAEPTTEAGCTFSGEGTRATEGDDGLRDLDQV